MSEMTDKEFQAAAKEAARVTFMRGLELAAEKLETADLDDVVRVVNSLKDVAGAVLEKKTDPYASLPVFNITFTNGGAQVTAQAPPVVEVVEEVQPSRQQLEPPAPVAEEKAEPQSIDELLASINLDVLG